MYPQVERVRLAGGLTHSAVGKTVVETVGETRHKVEDKIVALIKARPKITVVELARGTGLSTRGVEWNIRRLKAQGRLRRIGSTKAGRWEIVGTP